MILLNYLFLKYSFYI